MKLNGSHQLLVYADNVNILVGRIYTIKKNRAALVYASKDTGLEIIADNTKYMVMSRDQNATIKIYNSSFERVEQFTYMGVTLMNQNSIQEKFRADIS